MYPFLSIDTRQLLFMEMSVCNETVAEELGVCLAQFFRTVDDGCSKTSDSAQDKEDKSKKDEETISQAKAVEKSGEEKRFRTSLQQRRTAFQQKCSLPSHEDSAEAIEDIKHGESTCETVALSTDDDNSSIDTFGSVCDDNDDITASSIKQLPNFKQSSSDTTTIKPTSTETKQVSGPVLFLDNHSYIVPTFKEKKVSKSELLNSRLLYLQRRVKNLDVQKTNATQPSSSYISSYNKNTVDSSWIKHR